MSETETSCVPDGPYKVSGIDPSAPTTRPDGTPLIRGYIDGCFDLMHSGHFNAIRQAKQLCDVLVVGVHSDTEITQCKGPPVMHQKERYAILDHLKWVGEIIYNVPYTPSLDTLNQCSVNFCVHGDDMPMDTNGVGAYDAVRDAGKLKIVKRTEGVSTTDLVTRLLNAESHAADSNGLPSTRLSNIARTDVLRDQGVHTLQTVHKIAEFAAPHRAPKENDVVVYIDGDFDLFNVHHASLLENVKKLGTFLLVGVYDDRVCERLKGKNHPLHNLHERILSVCACKHVDDVIIGSPYVVTTDLLTTMKVSIVAQGSDCKYSPENFSVTELENNYKLPKEMGIFKLVESDFSYLTTDAIIDRVHKMRNVYTERNAKRVPMEKAYYQKKKDYQKGVPSL
eukprot:GEMP01062034.1.p1 GENE.GEMP01062034.1~~GEMP01062034.1.p1  ORF type:complete len:395 (+),score=57.17 GEMP01062034.1:162-1346(+)